jgi:two-component system, NtrC family, nitrogen regulation sensor histidine kinase NtrY
MIISSYSLMAKRTALHLIVTCFLFIWAVVYNYLHKDTDLLQQYAEEISVYLNQQELATQNWIVANQVALKSLTSEGLTISDKAKTIQKIQQDESELFTFLMHKEDSLLYWSNNKAIPSKEEFKKMLSLPEKTLLNLVVGNYFAVRVNVSNTFFTTLIPIKYRINIEKNQQQNLFPANRFIPDLVKLSNDESPYLIKVGGQKIGYLNSEKSARFAQVQWFTFILGLLFLFSLFTLINRTSIWAARKYRTGAGSAILIGSVSLLLGLNFYFKITDQFDALSIFAQKFNSPSLGNSLGEWLLHIIVLLWLMVFFHREFPVNDLKGIKLPNRLFLCALNNLAMMMSVLMIVYLFKQLIFDSGIIFDFDNILNLNRYALLSIVGIILLLAGLFLFSHRIMHFIDKLELNRKHRVFCLVVASLIMLPFCLQLQFELTTKPREIIAFSLVYIVAFDFYIIDGKRIGMLWIVLWLVIFSGFSSLLLYKYNEINDFNNRLACAKMMTEDRDEKEAEPQLETLSKLLNEDKIIDNLIPPREFNKNISVLNSHLAKLVFNQNYIFQNYKFTACGFDADQNPTHENQAISYENAVKQNWEKGKSVTSNPALRWVTDSIGNFRYILHRKSFRQGSTAFPVDLFVFFEHEFPKPTRVYSTLFYNQPYKKFTQMTDYDFAIFKEGNVLTEHGKVSASLFDKDNFPDADTYYEPSSSLTKRKDIIYTSKDGNTTVVVGKEKGSFRKRIYLFSSLFTLLSLFMIALAGINSKLRILPDYYQFVITTKGSLAKRIQYSMVGLLMISIAIIGVMTYYHFTMAAERNEFQKLDYRTSTLLTHISAATREMKPTQDSSLKNDLPLLIKSVANSFSSDVNLYSKQGELIYTTQESLQSIGLLSRKMNSRAFADLHTQARSSMREPEKIGGYDFHSNYAAIRNKQNELLGFIGVPFYLSKNSVSADVSDFIGIIASLYVFLLLIAGAMAFRVAASIISPIEMIAKEITALRLEDRNQYLPDYLDNQDELSELVLEYNRMVDKLEDSKGKLISFEREGAWREMARQVAHDIKNPLTAMKLSMQQLQRLSSGDTELAKVYLKTALKNLLEQIDSLAHIASEFSMIAKLDITQKFDMIINDVVNNVFELFSEMQNIDFQMNMSSDRFHILGDKNHLMRVFNNLIINATQAIPSDRRGLIRVAVYRDLDKVIIRMSDNGDGIPAEVVDKVFEPNFTTKTSGSGLGLAICKKIIDVHDGNIYFKSRPGQGTEFFIEFPITFTEETEED